MNVLAIVASPRKGSTTDTLVDKAIEGVKSKHPDAEVEKINLYSSELRKSGPVYTLVREIKLK